VMTLRISKNLRSIFRSNYHTVCLLLYNRVSRLHVWPRVRLWGVVCYHTISLWPVWDASKRNNLYPAKQKSTTAKKSTVYVRLQLLPPRLSFRHCRSASKLDKVDKIASNSTWNTMYYTEVVRLEMFPRRSCLNLQAARLISSAYF
jgi:hypothetical protein